MAVLCRYLEEMVAVRLTYLEPRDGFAWPNPPETNYVDTHVFAKLKQMSIPPSDLCTDAEFVRRAYLDAIGRLPTPAEAKAFLADTDGKKRDRLIDALVDRPSSRTSGRSSGRTCCGPTARRSRRRGPTACTTGSAASWQKGTPVDEVVRELLTASGNTYANPPANYYRIAKDPPALAETTAQLFLGVRMQCAKCHNHPFERWTQDDYYGLAAWFARTRLKPDPSLDGAKPTRKDRRRPRRSCSSPATARSSSRGRARR